jgi:hypothetical protein
VRNFRHAATLTASQLISTWIGITTALTEARETADFQLRAEEKKKEAGKVRAFGRVLLNVCGVVSLGRCCFVGRGWGLERCCRGMTSHHVV